MRQNGYGDATNTHIKFAKKTPEKAKKPGSKQKAAATGAVWKLIFSSPAIDVWLEGDPSDDCSMDDFGDLVEHFSDGGERDEIHKTQKGAIEAAWKFVQGCIESDVNEGEFRREPSDEGTWFMKAYI